MLQISEDFLKPEIRNGFFVDATMKTIFAAELEVLSQIAVVCERHNIQWYAAYGTLLGAIRHEGFIPWDDDIDIWVMREDYNLLVTEYLPKELPAKYLVKSTQNDLGYDQFHSCVVNGESISMEPERLEEFHGCPFLVAIDIFVLDYLPRDEKKQKRQKQLVELAGNAANLAFKLDNGEIGPEDEAETVQNITDVMDYLESVYPYRFRRAQLMERDWKIVGCDCFNCAQSLAGMYGEKESDHIVEYWHYISWDRKCPKEWFAEVYSATFEDFMIPIPSGYEEILHFCYGDYMTPRRNTSAHEYPLYAKQLRQLKAIVKKKEEQLLAQGLIPERQKDDRIGPADWKDRMKDKKVVLYISGLPMYSEYGEKALDKLEKNLKLFEENRDKILLWWRPQSQMKTLLTLLDPSLVGRYENILKEYKESGWGICDESDDVDRALEYCCAYYGEMSEAARVTQRNHRPVMIEQMLED